VKERRKKEKKYRKRYCRGRAEKKVKEGEIKE